MRLLAVSSADGAVSCTMLLAIAGSMALTPNLVTCTSCISNTDCSSRLLERFEDRGYACAPLRFVDLGGLFFSVVFLSVPDTDRR